MKNIITKFVITVVIVLSLYGVYMNWRLNKLQSELDSTRVSRDSVTVLVDSSRAREASTSLQKDSLKDALSAADALNGKLIAAAKIKIRPRTVTDTLVLPADSATQVFPFRDRSDAGFLRGEIRVSPAPTLLEIQYSFTPAPLDLTVSLIQMKSNAAVFAVKTNRGDSVSIEAPFARIPERSKFLTSYVSGLYNPLEKSAVLRAGAQLRVPLIPIKSLFMVLEGEQGFSGSDANNIYLGVRKVF